MQVIRKSSRKGESEPEINDSEERFDRRSRRLQAENDFDRNIKSKFD